MQPPEKPEPQQPPAWHHLNYDPAPQQPPAGIQWTKYATQVRAFFRPETALGRQMAIYRADVAKWSQRLSIPVPALWALMAVLVVCSCSFWGISVLSAIASPSPSQAVAASATQTANAPTAVIGPTATPFPTFTPGPSPTPLPTATPTPPPTPEQSAYTLIANALGDHNGLSVKWNAADKILTVEHDASDNLTNDLIRVGIEDDTFEIMKAIYTRWNLHPSSVIVHENGPTQDKYGNESKGAWGTAVLLSETAALFNWGNLDYKQAWDVYDVGYFINGI